MPKLFPPSLTLGFNAHTKNISRQGVCATSACLCSQQAALVERSRALRPQIRAADLPGKPPVRRGAHGKLRAAAWKVCGFICSTDTFCVQAHLSQQNRGIEEHDGSGNIHRYKYSWPAAAGSRLKLSSFAVCVWLHSDKPSPAALCCLGCSEGWMATGQQIHWPDWNISRVKSSKCLFLCVPCCPSPGPEALLGWAGPGGSLISWEGKPGPGPWSRADLLGLPLIF